MLVVEVLDTQAGRHKKAIKAASKWLMKTLNKGSFYLEVYLVGNDFMNKNVLSFAHPKGFPLPDLKQQALGEIYLNPKYIKAHGEDLTYMLIHGFLHLLGYDHIKKSDRIVMERKEQKLLTSYTMYAISGRTRHRIGGH